MTQLKQIAPYLHEIPKTGGMRVPGRIYASRQLLESQKVDEAIEQVRNVAHLPGIVGYALAMPDFHWGYGFPIGGVAAFDLEEGVISPGGVGYDINCLSGDAQVLFAEGYRRTIREIVEEKIRKNVFLFDRRSKQFISAAVNAGLASAPRRRVLNLLSGTGRTLSCTEDHRVLTPDGMRQAGNLRLGDRIAVCPFEGTPYVRPSRDVIVSVENLREAARRVGKQDRGNGVEQAIRHLAPLLPLTFDHPALPGMLKLAGLVLGDGSIHFDYGTGKGHVTLSGKKKDLVRLSRELLPWARATRIFSRHRHHRIPTAYGMVITESTEHYLRFNSTGIALLLAAMGIPVGPKATQNWGMPTFLDRAPLWQQRLFLAGFFGAELTAPDAFPRSNFNFKCPVLVVVKREGFVDSGIRFLGEVAKMLERFGIASLTISRRNEQLNTDGRLSIRLRLVVSSRDENLIRLWSRVGYEGNARRSLLANQAVAYLHRKRAFLDARHLLRQRILEIRAVGGWGAKKIHAAVNQGPVPVNLRFVEHTIYGASDRVLRASAGFPTFNQWRRKWTSGGLVWEEVSAIRQGNVARVFDIGLDHPDHNFVANGVVVHNCGVRLIRTNLKKTEVVPKLRNLVQEIFRTVPAGVGSEGAIKAPRGDDARELVTQGAKWAVYHGYGTPEDLDHIEDSGLFPGADPDAPSDRAYSRGMPQIGTLGSGNHFLEIQAVDEIYRKDIAQRFGLEPGTICFSIHSGSRGFGYQVCEDSLKSMIQASRNYGIALPDRQLCCAPFSSPEARRYLSAMACAANFAWVNRQVMMALTRRIFARQFGMTEEALGARLIYDVCHNIAKVEDHGGRRLCVHRKGATRAFGPGHPVLPPAYRDLGQPTFIPGDMGRASFLLIGKEGSMRETFGSTCHGAGRAHSRSEMKRRTQGRNLFKELEEERGVIVMAHGRDSVAEEMPEAYKDASLVVDVMEQAGITDKVARLLPIGCIKG